MKREITSFDIYVIVKEMEELKGSYIDKIYQLSRNEILIRFRNIQNKKRENIYIRNGEFISVTDKDLETPERPSVFAMTLRKYLQNGKIANVKQHEFDRILKIEISKKEGIYTLVVEFFSEGNIILVDPNEKIIYPLKKQAWAHRKVKGREPYVSPPSQINPFKLYLKETQKLIKKSDKDIVRTLAVNLNLSGFISEEICTIANIDKNTKIENTTSDQIEKIYNSLKKFLERFEKKEFTPYIVKKDSKIIDIIPFEFEIYKDYTLEETESLVRGLEKFICTKEKTKKQVKKENKFEKKLGKLDRQKIQQENAIEKIGKEVGEKKHKGDLIYLHYQKIEKLLNQIKKILELKEKTEYINKINELDFVKEFSPNKNTLILKLKDTDDKDFDVKLDFRKTVSENAEKAYDENKKLKSKLHGAKKALKKTHDKIKNAKKQKEKEEIKLEEIEQKKKEKKKEKTKGYEK